MHKINLPLPLDNWWWAILLMLVFNTARYILVPGIAYLICYHSPSSWVKKFKIQPAMPGKKQMRHELLYSFSSILIFSVILVAGYLLYINNHTTLYTDIHQYGYGYFFLSLVLMIILHDTYFYWVHRLLHTRWFFKKIHRVHHRSANPTPLAANAFHPLEALILGLIVFPLITIWPVHILALLLFNSIVVVTNVVGHLGFEFMPARLRHSSPGKYISSSTHHNLHHQKSNKNFGLYFTFWDALMKTLQADRSGQKRFTGKPGVVSSARIGDSPPSMKPG
ncbi:MAG: sterol desaturase family protein [Chitinophagaceae bacterium]